MSLSYFPDLIKSGDNKIVSGSMQEKTAGEVKGRERGEGKRWCTGGEREKADRIRLKGEFLNFIV